MRQECGGGTDNDRGIACGAAHGATIGLDPGERRLDRLKQCAPRRRQDWGPDIAIEQRSPEPVFQNPDLLANRGSGHAKRLSRILVPIRCGKNGKYPESAKRWEVRHVTLS